jgi:Zn-finger protein
MRMTRWLRLFAGADFWPCGKELCSHAKESILQLLDALEQLESVATNVFTRIEKRVGQNRNRLTSLSNRCVHASLA